MDAVGTQQYLSPERVHGEQYSYPADVWGLGLTLIYCATGLTEAVSHILPARSSLAHDWGVRGAMDGGWHRLAASGRDQQRL